VLQPSTISGSWSLQYDGRLQGLRLFFLTIFSTYTGLRTERLDV